MKASDLVAEGIRILKASPAIDHWQKDREEIESEELLQFALLSDEYDPDEEVAAGDPIVLFGPGDGGEPTAQDWAEATGTISYEIVARMSSRLPRTYVGGEEPA